MPAFGFGNQPASSAAAAGPFGAGARRHYEGLGEEHAAGPCSDDLCSEASSASAAASRGLVGAGLRTWLLQRRRCLGALSLSATAVAVLLAALGAHLLLRIRSPEALARNPLAHTWPATCAACALLALTLAGTLPWLLMWADEPPGSAGAFAGASAELDAASPARALQIAARALPLPVLAWLLATPAGACVRLGPGRLGRPLPCVCDRVVVLGSPELGEDVPADLTLAFVGDSGVANGDEVLGLLRKEETSAVVFNGDAAYLQANSDWVARFRKHLGSVPFYLAAGDGSSLREAQESTARAWRAGPAAAACRGEVGVRTACTHRGVGLLLGGGAAAAESSGATGCAAGGRERREFFEGALEEFARGDVRWPICVFDFHSNAGESNWDNYDLCLRRGALIVSSHRRPFARTPEVDRLTSAAPHLHVSRMVHAHSGPAGAAVLQDGHSMVVFTGVGGPGATTGDTLSSILDSAEEPPGAEAAQPGLRKEQESGAVHSLPAGTKAAHASQQSADAAPPVEPAQESQLPPPSRGVFFCRFHVHGDPRLAHCYFKDVAGTIADDFYLRRPDAPAGGYLEPDYV